MPTPKKLDEDILQDLNHKQEMFQVLEMQKLFQSSQKALIFIQI